jgi:hypothetical protein
VNWGYKTANKGAALCDGWKVFFDASLTCSCVLLMVGDLDKDFSRGSTNGHTQSNRRTDAS